MEDEENSVKENLSKRTVVQKNATETERSSDVKSKISTLESTPEEERKFTAKNSFRKETTKENNGILRGTTASESYFSGVNDTGRADKSVRELEEGAVAKIATVDQPEAHPRREKSTSDGSGSATKNPAKIGDAAKAGGQRRQRPFREMIGKRERRREELEKTEGNLRQRLDMLECSMPAVMVWNIWRMSQGAPVCRMRRILEKQFEDTRELPCRSTPSRHYDCRVREVEAERKLALRKVEEARALWSEKLARLEERRRKLEEAKKIQAEQKSTMEQLSGEAEALRQAIEKSDGERGDARCKRRRLGRTRSVTSVDSGDIRCLEKLQRLAEEEMIMKREIDELERREEAYMRTLQQADELWSKMEGDAFSATGALREQLDMKTAANQQLAGRVCELEDALEKCRTKLAACTAELERLASVERVAVTIGRDDDVAVVADKEVAARPKVAHRPIGRVDDVATVKDAEVLARVEVTDKSTLARAEVADAETLARIDLLDADAEAVFVGDDKYVSIKPDVADRAVDRPADLVRVEDAASVIRPEDLAYEQQRFKEVREYLAKLDSLEDLYKDDGVPCAPDFVCNDEVSTPTGMTDEELAALGVEPDAAPMKKLDEKLAAGEDERDEELREELTSDVDGIKMREKEFANEIPGVEIKRKVIEIAEEPIIEVAPVKETVRESAANGRPVTMPSDVRRKAPEVEKIEADQGIVIRRDTIQSWIDAIDAIRVKAAKHSNCHAAKRDADILAEEVGAYIGIRPKEVAEEDVIIAKDKQEEPVILPKIAAETTRADTERAAELDAEEGVMPKTELLNESKAFPHPEKIPPDVKALMKPAAELPPDITKEEISTGMEPPTAASIDDSFQSPTFPVKEDLKEDTVSELVPNQIEPERIEAKEETPVNEIVRITKEAEVRRVEESAIGELMDRELTVNDKMVKFTADEKTSVLRNGEKPEEEEKVISEHVERIEQRVEDAAKETVERREAAVEKVTADEALPAPGETDESKLADKLAEKLEETPQLDRIRMPDIEATTPHVEIIETRETAEALLAAEMREKKQTVAEEATVDAAEIREIIPETVFPTVHLIEVEEFEPAEVSIVDIEKIPIADAIEEKVQIEEPSVVETKEESVEDAEPLILDAVMKAEVEIEEPVTDKIPEKIEVAEVLSITDIMKEDKIEVKIPTADTVMIEEIKIEEPPTIADVTAEKVEVTPPTILKEVAEIEVTEQPTLEIIKDKDEEIKEMPEKVAPPIKILEEEKEETLKEVALSAEPTVEEKKEAVPVVERKTEVVEVEEKIPIAEIRPAGVEMSIDPRLAAQPYFVIAKIEEKELLQIIPTTKPLHRPPPAAVPAEQVEITRTDVVQTEIAETKIVQTEIAQAAIVHTKIAQSEVAQTGIAQTEVAQTEVVQITTQTISTAGPPRAPSPPSPMRVLSEYFQPAELKAPSTEFAGDRPEITGRKMLWHKRLKDQSTVTTASIGAQTDKTGHVSHDRIRDERERTRALTDELLRSIKIAAAGITRPDAEREIRTINYGERSDETGQTACNCCLCGGIPSPPSVKPRLKVQPQIDAKTTTPPAAAAAAAAAFRRVFAAPKIDRPVRHDRLCPDCKTKIQGTKHHIDEIVGRVPRDSESCANGKPYSPRKKAVERKDQASLAKIPRRKTNSAEQSLAIPCEKTCNQF